MIGLLREEKIASLLPGEMPSKVEADAYVKMAGSVEDAALAWIDDVAWERQHCIGDHHH